MENISESKKNQQKLPKMEINIKILKTVCSIQNETIDYVTPTFRMVKMANLS